MPWNGCKFEGDPSSPAELFSKQQYGDPDYNQTVDESDGGNCADLAWFVGGKEKTPEKKGQCGEVIEGVRYPCVIEKPGWDGGLCEASKVLNVGEDGDFARFISAGIFTFDVIGKVARLSSFAVAEFAKNDYRKDLQGAKTKMEVASNNYYQAMPGITSVGEQMQALGANIDNLKGELDSIKIVVSYNWSAIESVLSDLASLNAQLEKAKADKAYADNRSNFPAGIAGSIAQRNARIKANADIADASSKIVDKEVEHQTKADEYNQSRADGRAVAQEILANQSQIDTLKGVRDQRIAVAQSAVSLRNQGINDVMEAQTTLAPKIDTSLRLAQTAIGASGASEALKFVQTREYFRATGAGMNAGIDIGLGYHVPGSIGLNPYIPLFKTAITEAMKTFQSGGNAMPFVMNLGEALIGLKSSEQILNAVGSALDTMEADPYGSWQIIAVQTHEGVGVLGKVTTFASPFIPGGALVTPYIPYMIPIAQSSLSGSLSTAVEAGYKFGMGEGFSAELGTGRLSGLSVILFGEVASLFGGPIIAMENAFNSMTGEGGGRTNMAIEIQKMARTSKEKFGENFPPTIMNVGRQYSAESNDPQFVGEVIE